jgi:hypothetical protein
MKEPLNALARKSGQDILVSPIPGFGSYQQGQTASAGTGSGGGHLDLYLTRLNQEQKLRLEGLAREIGFYADIREPRWWSPTRKKYLTANWSSHLHLVLKSCGHLSAEARSQLNSWYAGGNGLVGDDPDDGDRRFLKQTWAQYLRKKQDPPAPEPYKHVLDLAKVMYGKTNDQFRLYQAAAWKALSASARATILKKHGLKTAQIADGYYGKVTRELTQTLYREIAKKEPKGGWPPWLEPGPRLLQRLGFIVRTTSGSRTVDPADTLDPDQTRDEFGEPAAQEDEVFEMVGH